jgi:hypothetical protein
MCPKNGCNGSPTTLAADTTTVSGLASDGISVYWTELGDGVVDGQAVANVGSVRKCSAAGCNGNPIAVASRLNVPVGIAVDNQYVYWADGSGGQILRAPK